MTGTGQARLPKPAVASPPPAPFERDPIRTPPVRVRNARHFDELEAYRGVAALLIVVFHAYQYTRQATHQPKYLYEGTWLHHLIANMEAGVAWFFALSGFLLFLPIARGAITQSGRQSTRAFLVRRAIRIIPLYYFAIIVVWSWRFTGGAAQWRDLFNHLTFTHTFSDDQLFWTIGPAWSLAVEVHFYIVLALAAPLVYLFAGWLPGTALRVAFLTIFVATVWLAGIGYLRWLEHAPLATQGRPSLHFSLPAKLDNFAVGMLLAVLVATVNGRWTVPTLFAWLLRIGGFAVIAWTFAERPYSSVPVPPTFADTWFHAISAAAFTAIIASSVLGPRESPWMRVLAQPWLQMLGLLSYSVYMWHEPILIELGQRENLIHTEPNAFLLNVAWLVALSLAIAYFSYRAIERPTMELRHLFGPTGRFVRRYLPISHRPTPATATGSD